MSRAERRTMVIRAHPALSLSRQCRLLSIGRSSLYYTPKGESPEWTHPGKVEAPYTVCIASASNLTGLVKSSVECRRTGL